MGVGVFARLQHTSGIRQWDPRAENWVPICASMWDQNPRLGPAISGAGPVTALSLYCTGCCDPRGRHGSIRQELAARVSDFRNHSAKAAAIEAAI
jgi:hypothetical protein